TDTVTAALSPTLFNNEMWAAVTDPTVAPRLWAGTTAGTWSMRTADAIAGASYDWAYGTSSALIISRRASGGDFTFARSLGGAISTELDVATAYSADILD